MMIKCTKCGFENQMGAIFCRQCGEKIDMNAVSPESLESGAQKEKRKERVKKLIRSLFYFLILILFAGFFAAIFAPWGHPPYTAPKEDGDDYANNNTKILTQYQKTGAEKNDVFPEQMRLSEKDLNLLFSKLILPEPTESKKEDGKKDTAAQQPPAEKTATTQTSPSGSAAKPMLYVEHVSFANQEKGLVMTIYAKVSFLPLICRFEGVPEKGTAESPVSFKIQSARIGHLPLPFAQAFILSKLGETFTTAEMKRIFDHSTEIKMDDRELVISFKKEDKNAENASSAPASQNKQESTPVKKTKKTKKKKAKKD